MRPWRGSVRVAVAHAGRVVLACAACRRSRRCLLMHMPAITSAARSLNSGQARGGSRYFSVVLVALVCWSEESAHAFALIAFRRGVGPADVGRVRRIGPTFVSLPRRLLCAESFASPQCLRRWLPPTLMQVSRVRALTQMLVGSPCLSHRVAGGLADHSFGIGRRLTQHGDCPSPVDMEVELCCVWQQSCVAGRELGSW